MAYQLIQDHLSTDTVEALEQALESARQGQIVGVAFALMLKRRRFLVDCAGEACRDPLTARGAVSVLDDQLALMIQGQIDSNTTL
jgi:hypothetical protein